MTKCKHPDKYFRISMALPPYEIDSPKQIEIMIPKTALHRRVLHLF